MSQTLIVKEDGSIVGPYAELLMPAELSEAFGEVKLQRATDIIWNVNRKTWGVYVHSQLGEGLLFADTSREVCLNWERDMLERNHLRWVRKNVMSATYWDGQTWVKGIDLARRYDIYERLSSETPWNYERWVLLPQKQ